MIVLVRKFGVPGSLPLWERLTSEGRHDPEGWEEAANLVADRTIVVLLEHHDGNHEAVMLPGAALAGLLAETRPFVLYVTDEAADFLICHNDHDALIVADPDSVLARA